MRSFSSTAGIALFFLALAAGAWAKPPAFEAQRLESCDAAFVRDRGWTGADGAYSVPLSEGVTLWLFGDTWVGDVRSGRHENATLVNNSLALQSGRTPSPEGMAFFFGEGAGGQPGPFFLPPDRRGWYWPCGGACTGAGLFLFMMHIERTAAGDPFGFRQVGTALVRVDNPADPPRLWRMTQRRVPHSVFSGSERVAFGSAVLREGGVTYVYGTRDWRGRRHAILARVEGGDVADFGAWRFYDSGAWREKLRPGRGLFAGVASEYSVSYQPSLKKYIAVTTDQGLSGKVVARLAERPWGPWEKPFVLYRCPEFSAERQVVTYAAKAHPELALRPDELIFTYVASSLDFWALARDASLYRPLFVRVRFR